MTPFARLQLASVNQTAFSEWGANSLSLNVAQQTTTSVRTTFGADLGMSVGLGNQRTLDMGVRVGWLHEYADTGRPVTAAFAGAPANGFTVFGATPQRDFGGDRAARQQLRGRRHAALFPRPRRALLRLRDPRL